MATCRLKCRSGACEFLPRGRRSTARRAPRGWKNKLFPASPVKQELECFQLIEIFLPAILDARCPRDPHRAAPGTGGFQFESVVPGYSSLLLQRSSGGRPDRDGRAAAGEGRMPRWPRPCPRGGERRSRRARSTGLAPRPCPPAARAPHSPGFCFLAKTPCIPITQIPPGISS